MTLAPKLRYVGLAAALVGGGIGANLIAPLTAHSQNVQQGAPEGTESAISPDASAALARMNKTLSSKQFSFRSSTVRAYVGPNGELLHIVHSGNVVIRRPDRVSVVSSGDDGTTKMLYDGKSLVVYGVDQKQYASVPVPATIDGMMQIAEDRMGIDFPLADLISADPEKSLMSGVTSGGEVGTADIDGVRCRHYYFNQAPDLELELWLEDNERALPRRLFVTYRALPGHPTFLAALSDWNFSIHPTDADFAFSPPAGVKLVELKPRMEAMATTPNKERAK